MKTPTSMTIGTIRMVMENLVDKPKGSIHRFPCASPQEAIAVRARMNRLRLTDRHQNMALYAQRNRQLVAQGFAPEPIPAEANTSVFDQLILRARGNVVEVQVGAMSAADFLALAGITLEGGEEPVAPKAPAPKVDEAYQGDYDTAPKADENPFG